VSARELKLPEDIDEWPRTVHATLTETLSRSGAAVIAFDLIFEEPRETVADRRFADALYNAGNVVLCEFLDAEHHSLSGLAPAPHSTLTIERLIAPVPLLVESAAALAPFPLPKNPHGITAYWTIKASAGDTPTFPVVAFQLYALPVYNMFLELLSREAPDLAVRLPHSSKSMLEHRGVIDLICTARELFHRRPNLAGTLRQAVRREALPPADKELINALITMYSCEKSQHLNFYGPPGSLPILPFYQVIQAADSSPGGVKELDLSGKAVFVGPSELYRADQTDDFHTPFSQESGVYLTGVEIAATAFANLLENSHLVQPSRDIVISLIFCWGMVLAIMCRQFPTAVAAAGVLALSALYLLFAYHRFTAAYVWYPVVAPLGLQAPLTFFGVLFLNYHESNRERKALRKAFGYYLPGDVVDQLVQRVEDVRSSGQTMYGACLSTDAGQYTALAEAMEPIELKDHMNDYYEVLFQPVKRHRGMVSDVVGDAMLALWTTTGDTREIRRSACMAALEIDQALQDFARKAGERSLSTRVGVHFGKMLVGHVGAADHFEYRAIGDCINTVSRIEELSKQLRTKLLASQEVLSELDDLVARKLGTFLLRGKSSPVVLYELIGRRDQIRLQQQEVCSRFAQGLAAFRRRAWREAEAAFSEVDRIADGDGPSQFYLGRCKTYSHDPPDASWQGEIKMG